MRKIIVHEFITLDGVIQAPGGVNEDTEGGFTFGGWTQRYWHDDIGARFGEIMKDADAFLLGRKTWEIHGAAFEPLKPGDPFGDLMNGAHKYVVSKTLKSADAWQNSTIISDDVVEEIRKLKNQPGKNILLDGSSMLVHTLIKNELVDELHLHMYPLILGNGKRLYPKGKKMTLKLIESKVLPTGVVYLKYQPAS